MDMIELAERCERGSGPDRELDAAILCSIDGWTAREVFGMAGNAYTQYRDYGGMVCAPDPLTTSLDASVALLERVLPGWGYWLRRHETPRGMWSCCSLMSPPDVAEGDTFDIWAPTSARALLAAILRALAAKDESHD